MNSQYKKRREEEEESMGREESQNHESQFLLYIFGEGDGDAA